MALTKLKLLVCVLALGGSTLAQAECFKSVSEMKANNVKERWVETTENDGKPLMISIANGGGGLVYSARKAGATWLTGNVSVLSLWRRYPDYLEEHPGHEQCADGRKDGVALHAVGADCG